jgi:hypothetical protein
MRRLVLFLVSVAAVSAAYAQSQNQKNSGIQGTFGSPESATGGLRGVYGPPESAAGHLTGVYAPPQSPSFAPLPRTITGVNPAVSGSVPSVSLPGEAHEGESLPAGVKADPMPDRPGYGRAVVNGRNAIIEMGDNRIVQFSD